MQLLVGETDRKTMVRHRSNFHMKQQQCDSTWISKTQHLKGSEESQSIPRHKAGSDEHSMAWVWKGLAIWCSGATYACTPQFSHVLGKQQPRAQFSKCMNFTHLHQRTSPQNGNVLILLFEKMTNVFLKTFAPYACCMCRPACLGRQAEGFPVDTLVVVSGEYISTD